MKNNKLPATVIALGLVSLFTDLSSEMIYPLLPLFLITVLGAGAVSLGVIEGVAESTAALLKVGSGIMADRVRWKKPFILLGYGLAGIARPLIGLASAWPFVLGMRFVDRIGKGIRTAPRDALIAEVTPPDRRGRAFGFHRSMDHAGAVLGPLAAMVLLSLAGMSLRHVFLLAVIPAAVVVVIILIAVREPERSEVDKLPIGPLIKNQWNALGRDFKVVLLSLLVFTLGNSSDAFILLKLSDAIQKTLLVRSMTAGKAAAVTAAWVAGLWAAHHVVKMVCTYFGGTISDRLGRRKMVVAGWLVYAAVYAGFAWAGSPYSIVVVFMFYGIYYGLTEPVEKAWIADLAPVNLRGSAFGWYNGVIGIGALPASLLFGLVWKYWGAAAAFSLGAGLALVATVLLLRVRTGQVKT